jgi:hypothetical protein
VAMSKATPTGLIPPKWGGAAQPSVTRMLAIIWN